MPNNNFVLSISGGRSCIFVSSY